MVLHIAGKHFLGKEVHCTRTSINSLCLVDTAPMWHFFVLSLSESVSILYITQSAIGTNNINEND